LGTREGRRHIHVRPARSIFSNALNLCRSACGLGPLAVTILPVPPRREGPPLPLAPSCNRQRPFFVAGDRQGSSVRKTESFVNSALGEWGQIERRLTGANKVDLRNLRELLKKVETASAGSPELDRDFVKAFRSAPPNVTCSIDAAVRLIETELSGWWWNCGYCAARNGASLYVPGSSRIGVASDYKIRPEHLQLLQDPKWGTLFDNGFHCDRGGTVPLAMLAVFLEARIAVELCEQRVTSENKVIRLNK